MNECCLFVEKSFCFFFSLSRFFFKPPFLLFRTTDAETRAGLKCSCGTLAPSGTVGILRARIDALHTFASAEDALDAAATLLERATIEDDGGSGSEDEARPQAAKAAKAKKKKVVSQKGNFTSYRNKDYTVPVKNSGAAKKE